ncbi:TetR/AcrR family transcriptional regulator [Leisingera daeponensis]|uniref:TetR/AcrR family transcriptional regulator n=1 Tax=Leisingera daeponensis TaxID=405746 RepID=UPI001C9704B1|nr:TetR/AcrR family transcriptional regulator [Leisingera daeponensis]MBY6058059.1 TetR/AcrR family transcriptional regulator [Leisingera daeponensis]
MLLFADSTVLLKTIVHSYSLRQVKLYECTIGIFNQRDNGLHFQTAAVQIYNYPETGRDGSAVANQKRQRLNPEDRRRLMLQGARASLAKYGAQGTGVREICKDLGVSPGLLTHYFDGKDSLFLAAYHDMAQQYLSEVRAITGGTRLSAEERLKQLFQLYFSDEWSNGGVIGTYTGFWSLSQTNPELKSAFEETFQEQRSAFELLIKSLIEERGITVDSETFATFLLVFLEGVWFESCLNPKAVDKARIQAFCWDWLECYLAAKSTAPA